MFAKIWAWIKKYIFRIEEPIDPIEPIEIEFEGSLEIDGPDEPSIYEGGTGMKKALIAGINTYPDAPLRGDRKSVV